MSNIIDSKTTTVTFNGYTFKDKVLAKSVNNINKYTDNIKSNYFKIGVELINIRDNKLYLLSDNDDLKTFADFCNNVFNLSKSTTYRIIAATEKVYLPFKDTDSFILKLPDVSIAALATLDNKDDIIDFCNEYEITLESTSREIQDKIRDYKYKNTIETDCASSYPDTNSDVKPDNDDVNEIKKTVDDLEHKADDILNNIEDEDNAEDEDNFYDRLTILLDQIVTRQLDQVLVNMINKFRADYSL